MNKYEMRNVLASTRNANCNCIYCDCVECFCENCCNDNITRGGHRINNIQQMVEEHSGEFVRIHTPYDSVITEKIQRETDKMRSQPLTGFNPSLHYSRTIIRQSSNQNNRIVVVLMGDGFTASQQGNWPNPASGTFLYHARSATNFMMQTYPFSLFEDLFTVYAIQTISAQSGISRPRPWPLSDINVRNRFGSFEPRNNEIDMPIEGQSDVRFIAEHFAGGRVNLNMIQVIANSDRFGGRAFGATPVTSPIVGIALTSVHTNHGGWRRTFIHEFGHSFGGLADEIDGSHAWNNIANMATDRNNVPWSHWIGIVDIGQPRAITARTIGGQNVRRYVPRGYDTDWLGITGGCLMSRSSGRITSFCLVCSAELTRRLAQHHSGETFVPRCNYSHETHITVQQNPRNRVLNYAFNGNTTVQHVTIPSCIRTIGAYAFLGATRLWTITNLSPIPQPINIATFARLDRSQITVIVPQGTTQAYRNAGWTGFNIVEPNFFAGGSGTSIDPFLISNSTHLNNVRYAPSAQFSLADNITLTSNWTPIPNFHGTFNGNNREIRGINISNPSVPTSGTTNTGFVARNYGIIANTIFSDVRIDFRSDHGAAITNVGADCRNESWHD